MRLSDVRFSDHGGALVAHLSGEVDFSNADSIGSAITLKMPNQALTLVLDLSDTEYLDSAGIRLIYELRERLRARGQVLRLVIPSSSPAGDALRLAGIASNVETAESVVDALRQSS